MHAAPSLILFTVLSGMGFGYLAFLGLGPQPPVGLEAFLRFGLAFGLAGGGLLASAFHLGNPLRAWRAFTQWRSSWLSREAWASVAALAVMGVFAAFMVFDGPASVGRNGITALGMIGAALCLITIFATSMIYTQITTVPRWNTPLTPLLFLSIGLSQGAILADQRTLAMVLLVVVAAMQMNAWYRGDLRFAERGHSLESATGLGVLGRVRLFASPHSGTNYLLQEFAYQVGRRHRAKLRVIALLAMAILPLLLLWLPGMVAQTLAIAASMIGALTSRWLFFAEAEHVVTLYYGMNARS